MIIKEKEAKKITEVSYDDARQRIKMLADELMQHKAQYESTMETITRLKYMIDSCERMKQIFVDDLESVGEEVYKYDEGDGPVSNLYPVQSGDE
jgi:hypothetical protein